MDNRAGTRATWSATAKRKGDKMTTRQSKNRIRREIALYLTVIFMATFGSYQAGQAFNTAKRHAQERQWSAELAITPCVPNQTNGIPCNPALGIRYDSEVRGYWKQGKHPYDWFDQIATEAKRHDFWARQLP